ncbi:hypothetical protein ACFQGE_14005 [Halomicroarcula sp. GCM10025817]|uniref:hypothetical protein n=1 Tax=Haloarcula TaxID=2237 RepID=UPI0023E78264|nr:hypothetical protein [Halomicroarcula sp. SYNS111]
MPDERDIGAGPVDGWRIRCPNGHVDLQDQRGPSAYCKTCGAAYPYDALVDARESSAVTLVGPADDAES